MGEHFTGTRKISLPVISFVTRKFVKGPNGEFVKLIGDELDVKINASITNYPHVTIKGASPNIQIAEGVIRELDQRAQIIADRSGLKITDDVRHEHWNHLQVDLKTLLAQAREKLRPEKADLLATVAVVPPAHAPINDNPSPKKDAEPNLSTAKAGPAFGEAAKPSQAPKIKKRVAFKSDEAFTPYNANQALTYAASLDTVPAQDEGGRRQFVNSYVYAGGPAGGGKTYSALKAATDAYAQGLVDEIIIIRPPTTAGKDPGAMPGDKNKKGEPYLTGGIASNLEKITGMTMKDLQDKKVIRPILPDWERGETYGTKASPVFVYIDEPQNLTVQQAELIITRLAEGSIMVWGGDIGGKQNDLKNQLSGFVHLIATQGDGKINDVALDRASAFIQFTKADSRARNKILPHVLEALENPSDKYRDLMKEYNEAGQNPRLTGIMEHMRLHAVEILEQTAKMTAKHYEKQVKKAFPYLFGEGIEGTVVKASNVTPITAGGRHI